MPEMDLKQPGFTYSVCGPFTKNKERIPKFKETGDTKCIYKNEFDKACFQRPKYDGYQRRLASMVYKFFDEKSAGSGVNMHANNEKLAGELHKPIIRRFKKERFTQDIKITFGLLI